jgi:hypothetical protein
MAKRIVKVDDVYEYRDGQKAAYIAPGLYVVKQDVANPNYDKRSKDFIRQPVIKAGTKVLVCDNRHRDYINEVDGGPPLVITNGCRITKMFGKTYDAFKPGAYAYEALVANLLPMDIMSTGDYLTNLKHQHGYAADPEDIVTRLLNSGVITREQVEKAVQDNKVEG